MGTQSAVNRHAMLTLFCAYFRPLIRRNRVKSTGFEMGLFWKFKTASSDDKGSIIERSISVVKKKSLKYDSLEL
jgi:hypothetical protein